jgi:hypothetical protein
MEKLAFAGTLMKMTIQNKILKLKIDGESNQ